MALGKQVRKYRERAGWKLETLSFKSGVEVGTISALENRDSSRSKFAPQLAKAFDLTLEQLLDEGVDYEIGARQVATGEGEITPPSAGSPFTPEQEEVASEFTLARALQVVAEALQDADEMTRETAAALLSNLAKAPGSQPNIAAAMQALLHFSSNRGVETRDLIKQPEQAK